MEIPTPQDVKAINDKHHRESVSIQLLGIYNQMRKGYTFISLERPLHSENRKNIEDAGWKIVGVGTDYIRLEPK